MKRIALGLLLATLLPATAEAGVRLGLGADYWLTRRGLFELTVSVDGHLARHILLGGRFGGLVSTLPNTIGIPLDLQLRGELAGGRVYLEGMGGPWILFEGAPLRAHVAFGFGIQSGSLSAGLEVGWLDPDPSVGLRFTFRI
ncbi:MAG: hypothetical protein ACOZIN_19940 [Myxococcota bacterium]